MSQNTAVTLMIVSALAVMVASFWIDANSKAIIRVACIEAGKSIVDGDCVEVKP